MKSLIGIILLAWSPVVFAQGETWSIDPVHSNVQFTVRHMVIAEVTGRFTEFSGSLKRGKDDFSGSSVEAVIKAASVNTDNNARDNDLRSPNFFDVTKYPELTFKSTSFEKTGENQYRVAGNLMIHGVTQPVVLDTKYLGEVTDDKGNRYIGFIASVTINRYDYGLKWNRAIEAGGVLVSEEVKISLNVKFVKKA